MNLHEFFIVCPLVFLAGFVDAISRRRRPDFIAGLYVRRGSGNNAIATNKLSSATGTAVSTWHLVKEQMCGSVSGSGNGSMCVRWFDRRREPGTDHQ